MNQVITIFTFIFVYMFFFNGINGRYLSLMIRQLLSYK